MIINLRNDLILQEEEKIKQILKLDMELLNNMGFKQAMVNKVYLIFNPEKVETKINYMTEINGIYQHKFIDNIDINEKIFVSYVKSQKKII